MLKANFKILKCKANLINHFLNLWGLFKFFFVKNEQLKKIFSLVSHQPINTLNYKIIIYPIITFLGTHKNYTKDVQKKLFINISWASTTIRDKCHIEKSTVQKVVVPQRQFCPLLCLFEDLPCQGRGFRFSTKKFWGNKIFLYLDLWKLP